MSETKHTPGPWYADDTGQIWRESTWDSYINGGKAGEEKPIATAHDGWDAERLEFFSVKANARLIAAAPELLDALDDLVSLAEVAMTEANRDGAEYEVGEELSAARAAIAKAKGETS